MTSQENQPRSKNYDCLYAVGHQSTDLYLTYCGFENCSPTHSFGPVWRNEYVIHFISGGHGYLQIEDTEYELNANQAFLVPAQVTTYYHADPDNPYQYTWIGFAGKKAAQYLAGTPLSIEHPICNLPIPVSEFYMIIQKILHDREHTLANDIKRTAYLYQILSILTSISQSTIDTNMPSVHSPEDYVNLALSFIKKNYDHICVADIVDYIGITRSWLYTLFKKKLNTSPQEYLISYRLEKSTQLLRDTSLSVADIAARIGYMDTLTFSKAFKKNFSVTPAQYRKLYFEKGEF